MHERPGHGDALALAARQLRRRVPHAVGEPHPVQGRPRPAQPLGPPDALVEQPVGHVLERRPAVQQEELLEHEAEAHGPDPGQRGVGQRGHVVADQPHPARRRPVERAHDVQQRRLARARRPDDRHVVARLDGEVDAVQHGQCRRAAAVRLRHVDQVEDAHGLTTTSSPSATSSPETSTDVPANAPVVTVTYCEVPSGEHLLHAVAAVGQRDQGRHRHHEHVGRDGLVETDLDGRALHQPVDEGVGRRDRDPELRLLVDRDDRRRRDRAGRRRAVGQREGRGRADRCQSGLAGPQRDGDEPLRRADGEHRRAGLDERAEVGQVLVDAHVLRREQHVAEPDRARRVRRPATSATA